MSGQNWLATKDKQYSFAEGKYLAEDSTHPYRLYRFLTDLEDVLNEIADDRSRLEAICPLVRQLLSSSSGLQYLPLQPNPETGWEVLMLYDEPFFPLTVQLVAWEAGTRSPIHNHGCWGLVALLEGAEKNRFWQRSPSPEYPDRIEEIGELILAPGDILCIMPEAIHQIEAIASQPTVSFNLYGETDYESRFQFDAIAATAQNF